MHRKAGTPNQLEGSSKQSADSAAKGGRKVADTKFTRKPTAVHSTFPKRGTMRDDVRPGLRITNYRKRAVIAFYVDAERVSIVGVFYGGQDYETILQDDSEDGSGH